LPPFPNAAFIGVENGGDGFGKKRASWVPALIEPPDPSAPLQEWQSYRADLDALEARLLISHPGLDWLEGYRRRDHGVLMIE
jgi:hypothetical protein